MIEGRIVDAKEERWNKGGSIDRGETRGLRMVNDSTRVEVEVDENNVANGVWSTSFEEDDLEFHGIGIWFLVSFFSIAGEFRWHHREHEARVGEHPCSRQKCVVQINL